MTTGDRRRLSRITDGILAGVISGFICISVQGVYVFQINKEMASRQKQADRENESKSDAVPKQASADVKRVGKN